MHRWPANTRFRASFDLFLAAPPPTATGLALPRFRSSSSSIFVAPLVFKGEEDRASSACSFARVARLVDLREVPASPVARRGGGGGGGKRRRVGGSERRRRRSEGCDGVVVGGRGCRRRAARQARRSPAPGPLGGRPGLGRNDLRLSRRGRGSRDDGGRGRRRAGGAGGASGRSLSLSLFLSLSQLPGLPLPLLLLLPRLPRRRRPPPPPSAPRLAPRCQAPRLLQPLPQHEEHHGRRL